MSALLALLPLLLPPTLQEAERRPLDHDAYTQWRQLERAELSRTGALAMYEVTCPDGDDGELRIHGVKDDREYRIARGYGAEFDWDEAYAVARVRPEREVSRRSEEEKWKKDDQPRHELVLLALDSGEVERVERVMSYEMPEKAGGWVAWLHYERTLEQKNELKRKKAEEEKARREAEAKEKAAERAAEAKEQAAQEPAAEEPAEEPSEEAAAEETPAEPEQQETPPQKPAPQKPTPQKKVPFKSVYKQKKVEDPRPNGRDGTELVVRRLGSEEEHRFEDVIDYQFNEPGTLLAFVTSSRDHTKDGLHVLSLNDGEVTALIEGDADFKSLRFDESGSRLAFLCNHGNAAVEPTRWALYLWTRDFPVARRVADAGFAGVPDGWGVSEHRSPGFSDSGRRLFFGTSELPVPEPEKPHKDDQVVVDVWSWRDDYIQPMQLVRLTSEKRRNYEAVVHLDGLAEPIVQLATPEVPDVSVELDGDSRYAVGSSDLPYRRMLSWDTQLYRDAYLVDVETGARRPVAERLRARVQMSPGGRYLYWWESEERAWYTQAVPDGEPVEVSAGIPHPLHNELHDSPSLPRSHGSAGWTVDDLGFLVNDRHDVWLLDPAGVFPPRCITEGVGRREDLRFRRVDLDREEEWIDPAAPMLLSAFDYRTKDSGFFRDRVQGDAEPHELVMDACQYGTPVKAEEGGVLRLTRSTFQEYPDLWVADAGMEILKRLSDVNPQQDEYLWGTAELVDWTSADGTPLQGILYKPDDFDPTRKYPMLVYFYERYSDNLHRHSTPVPSRSTIKFPFYTSRGYLVFVPDIPYKVGYPGRSALYAVLPGVASLIDEGFVQEDAIGVQGHSWGGYQIAYMITQTDLFAAAVSGAPVSNMTSAYGGIRWSSGMSRMFQYEKTQSRIGGTLWDQTQRYIDNSPVFQADKVETPVLILHNDEDGAVPWYQGIELFVALRRLDKPAWMLNYNGEGHGIGKYSHRRDYAIRMQQFFDHFLKDAPPPIWLAEGVPATEKERNLGLDLVGEEQDEQGD